MPMHMVMKIIKMVKKLETWCISEKTHVLARAEAIRTRLLISKTYLPSLKTILKQYRTWIRDKMLVTKSKSTVTHMVGISEIWMLLLNRTIKMAAICELIGHLLFLDTSFFLLLTTTDIPLKSIWMNKMKIANKYRGLIKAKKLLKNSL